MFELFLDLEIVLIFGSGVLKEGDQLQHSNHMRLGSHRSNMIEALTGRKSHPEVST